MIENMKVVEKWAVSKSMKSVGVIYSEEVELAVQRVCLYDRLGDIDEENDKQFIFRVYQVQYADKILEGFYLTVADAMEKMKEIESEAMTEEELFEYLEGVGYEIRFDDGSINHFVAGVMASNEGIGYDEKLERWFR